MYIKSLRKNTENAPKTSEGKAIYELIAEVHSFDRNAPNMILRNGTGAHTDGGLYAEIEMPIDEATSNDWTKKLTNNYLDMIIGVLKTVRSGDSRFKEPAGFESTKIQMLTAKKLLSRHKSAITTGLGMLLVAGGSLGTLAYQNFQEALDAKAQSYELGVVLTDVAETASNDFKELHQGIYLDGTLCDNSKAHGYLMGVFHENSEALARLDLSPNEFSYYILGIDMEKSDSLDKEIMKTYTDYVLRRDNIIE